MREMELVDMGQYTHNNEPVHHVLYLYSYCGRAWKTQKWVKHVLGKLYTERPDGYIGDEDTGQMSAWYVMSAIGLYPVCPGQDVYVLTAPQNAETRFGNVIIRRKGEGDYIQSATWRGKPHQQAFIRHAELKRGGTLEFTMGRQPSDWGEPPPSAWQEAATRLGLQTAAPRPAR